MIRKLVSPQLLKVMNLNFSYLLLNPTTFHLQKHTLANTKHHGLHFPTGSTVLRITMVPTVQYTARTLMILQATIHVIVKAVRNVYQATVILSITVYKSLITVNNS